MPFIYFIVIILVHGMEQRTMPTNIGMSHGFKMKGIEKNMKSISIGTFANFNPSLKFPLHSFFIFFISIPSSQFAVHIGYEVMILSRDRILSLKYVSLNPSSICESVNSIPVGYKTKTKKNKTENG